MTGNSTTPTDGSDTHKAITTACPWLTECYKDIDLTSDKTNQIFLNRSNNAADKILNTAVFSHDGRFIDFPSFYAGPAEVNNPAIYRKTGEQFVRNADGSESVVDESGGRKNGTIIAKRGIDGHITGSTDNFTFEAWAADASHKMLKLDKPDGSTVILESDSAHHFTITSYDAAGNKTVNDHPTAKELNNLFSTAGKTAGGSFDAITNIATLTGDDGKSVMYDFNNGAFGIDGLGPGNFIFNADGSATMPNGDVILSNGKVILSINFHSYAGTTDQAVTEAIQAEAQNYMTSVMGKIAGGSPVTSDDISGLSNCYSALGAAGMASIAASIMQGAVGGVMDAAAAQLERYFKALEAGVTDSGRVAQVMGDNFKTPNGAATAMAQLQNPSYK